VTDRYRHANARPLGYRVRRALLGVLIAVLIATGALALLAASGIAALYIWLAIVG
jgi:hypothetical protein